MFGQKLTLNYSDVGKARDILARWIREINNYAAQSDIDFLLRIKMSDIASNLNFEYNNQPLELVRRVKNVLETELRVIAEAQVRVFAEILLNFCDFFLYFLEIFPHFFDIPSIFKILIFSIFKGEHPKTGGRCISGR